ncbi:MAG TPA: T9SS type A sorting domain-containing protein [Bacteroidetes bacterium]|nr:T9SS type A sorting domain-containing protein [Bacteroidota bacterium]
MEDAGNNGQGYVLETSTCDLGKHYFYFRDGTGNDFNSSEQYRFSVTFTPFSSVDLCECNNSFSSACPIGICDTVLAVISPWFNDFNPFIEDEDFYQIELAGSEEVNVNISLVSPNIRICVNIYNSSQVLIDNFSGNIGQALNFNFIPPNDGIYYFKITDCNDNFDSQNQYELTIGCNLISSTNDLEIDKTVQLSPNPFNDQFSIQSEHPIQNLQVFNAIGNQIFFHEGAGFNEIKTDDWQSGIYFILIQTDAGLVVRRVIKR